MKKALFCLSLLAALALTACGGAQNEPEATPTPTPTAESQPTPTPDTGAESDPATPEASATPAPDEELSGMVDTLYAAYPVELMMMNTNAVDLSDADWCKYNTGLDADLAAKVDAAVVSESMTGSQAYSLVLARVKDEADAQTIADAMLENIQMNKWVCVGADKARVATFGDKVLFVMSSNSLTDADALMDAVPDALGVTFDYENSKDAADAAVGGDTIPAL
ncbi:MAG: hypothetical protein ACLTWO_11040 [Blautia massiliensis (ex Durand et al. 2017)]